MREVDRINRVTEKLRHVWLMYPDQRFFQLLQNINWDYDGDFWFLEDDETEKALDRVIREGRLQ